MPEYIDDLPVQFDAESLLWTECGTGLLCMADDYADYSTVTPWRLRDPNVTCSDFNISMVDREYGYWISDSQSHREILAEYGTYCELAGLPRITDAFPRNRRSNL